MRERTSESDRAASTTTPASILGFEDKEGWTVGSGTVSLTPQRTQGNAAMAVKAPVNYTTLTSAQLPATAVAGIADAGATVAVDFVQPTEQPNPWYLGALQMYVSCPSRNVYNAYLGQYELTGVRTGIARTFKYAVPDHIRSQLADGTYSDLFFTLALNAPYGATGTYLFDNLRIKTPGNSIPLGPGQSADLVALRSYTPDATTPGTTSFPAGVVQIPSDFHVKLGKAGNGTVSLALGYDGVPSITCAYAGSADGASYVLSSCTGGYKAGDLVGASYASLAIQSGDAAAGTTKIRAQLAINPVGDEVGADLVPPIPTWWGERPAEINQIASAFFEKQKVGTKTPGPVAVNLPTPDFARRHGDLHPVDKLDPNTPPPPNDPPFHKEGHANEGGTFDAYWKIVGNISGSANANRSISHYEAELSTHGVVFDQDITILRMNTTVDSDSGEIKKTGFEGTTSTGTLHMYLFGVELPGGGSADATTGFTFHVSDQRNFDAPPIPIWIFTIRAGLTSNASVDATGSLMGAGFQVNMTPQFGVGLHLSGDADIGVASGGIDVAVQLLQGSMPLSVAAGWEISTLPGVCKATMKTTANSSIVISSGGGTVSLHARLGICPFCYSDSWPLFSWDALVEKTYPVFAFDETVASFNLTADTCQTDLNVTMYNPGANATVKQLVPTTLWGEAKRPYTPSTNQDGTPSIQIATAIDCAFLTWTSTDPSDVGFPTTGCDPVVTFGNPGVRTIRLHAADSYGEVGTVEHQVTVSELTAEDGPIPYVISPTPKVAREGVDIDRVTATFTGDYVYKGTDEPVTLTWSFIPENATSESPIGTGKQVLWDPWSGYTTIKLTATDAAGKTNSTSFEFWGWFLR